MRAREWSGGSVPQAEIDPRSERGPIDSNGLGGASAAGAISLPVGNALPLAQVGCIGMSVQSPHPAGVSPSDSWHAASPAPSTGPAQQGSSADSTASPSEGQRQRFSGTTIPEPQSRTAAVSIDSAVRRGGVIEMVNTMNQSYLSAARARNSLSIFPASIVASAPPSHRSAVRYLRTRSFRSRTK